jgi:hypothetical protein
MICDGSNRTPVDEVVTGDCLRTFIGDQDCNWRPDNATNQMPRVAHRPATHAGGIRRTRPVATDPWGLGAVLAYPREIYCVVCWSSPAEGRVGVARKGARGLGRPHT